jgi:hypothetical protein
VCTGSPSFFLSAGFTLSITLGTGSMDGLALTDGFTGATGITLFAPDEAKSEPGGLRLVVRSMDGNCMTFGFLAPSSYFSS